MTAVIPSRASSQAHPGGGEPAFRAEGGKEGKAPAVPQPEPGRRGSAGGLRGSPSLAARGQQGGWGEWRVHGLGASVEGGWGSGRLCPEKGRGPKRLTCFLRLEMGPRLFSPQTTFTSPHVLFCIKKII